MVALGERFLYYSEIAGSTIIGIAFIWAAISAKPEDSWKFVIAAVLCFCFTLAFAVMYITSGKEREKKRITTKDIKETKKN
ncbi:MAG TPA: hypothetical protein VN372_15440 [Methanospirillum sp.]|nr:hypothetical protein [Methanospirillum sp.]